MSMEIYFQQDFKQNYTRYCDQAVLDNHCLSIIRDIDTKKQKKQQ